MMAERPEPLLTVAEVAEYLHVSPAFVRHHASGFRQPTIPSIKLGGAVRFRLAAIVEFVQKMVA
jgi:excisionase family DNA binding protein